MKGILYSGVLWKAVNKIIQLMPDSFIQSSIDSNPSFSDLKTIVRRLSKTLKVSPIETPNLLQKLECPDLENLQIIDSALGMP